MGGWHKSDIQLVDDPLWYKDAIIYELHVRAFYDSDADGVGNFRGLRQKLDYLHGLGVTALWLLPFCPSPLKDDGYDMADYTAVHPLYGTLADFELFLREAHLRGIRVITELALNHTSDQHPWFQRARRAKPGSPWRDFYVWSDTPEKYQDARIIFKDFEPSNWAWDPVAKSYYWHRFYAHQPDLNYDNPRVRKEILKAVDFWFTLGVDGLRLDAVPYLYEREGTNCENLAETHAFLRELRRHVEHKFPNRLFLAEANQWPEDAAAYFGHGDECHMNFHFPLMPRLFMAIHTEDRFPIIDILEQTPVLPENCQWGIFLRNHDELTLEMVTDEERDYMYRVYAQDPQMRINLGIRRRLAPLLGNHRRRIELMNGLLFSLPGSPILYYGDEIGMGDNVYLGDRNGVRTPMQWSADRNAGFSRANPQKLYLPIIIDPEYHYEAVNVEAQEGNPHSFLWWMKRQIALRKRYQAFGRGTMEVLHPENRKILAFLRRYQHECVLVVANLSRFVQYTELDLSAFKGVTPVEMFSCNAFPLIGEPPYFLTLAPHSFYWFSLEGRTITPEPRVTLPSASVVTLNGSLASLLQNGKAAPLEGALLAYLRNQRWFGGKARTVRSTAVSEILRVPMDDECYAVSLLLTYTEGDPETYVLTLGVATGEHAAQLEKEQPATLVARVQRNGGVGVLYEALGRKDLHQELLTMMTRRRRYKGQRGELVGVTTRAYPRLPTPGSLLETALLKTEQSNTSIVYDQQFILKLFRRVSQGVNPDLEIGRFLTEKVRFPHTAAVAGALEYRPERGEPVTVGILHCFVPHACDAWQYTIDELRAYFERAAIHRETDPGILLQKPFIAASEDDPPTIVTEVLSSYAASIRLLGQRTAELHLALASDTTDPLFAPEPFSALYQRSIYQSMWSVAGQAFPLLRRRLPTLAAPVRTLAQRVLELEKEVGKRFQSVIGRKITAMRIRHHGDYHLGQVLYTGKDFVIIDFEGEPARPLSERRIKRSPLRDVAGMLRSFHYAAYNVLFAQETQGSGDSTPEAQTLRESWARVWHLWVSALFLRSYRDTAHRAPFVPHSLDELHVLLDAYLLEKAVYELSYELNNRPEWVRIPLAGILQLLGEAI
ncbi:MAG: maltose alpha-D-glucosyltransferase [Deltaproteobacteria bacterium]|nr:maltose alpha-D-glucosyltransferase [Deltaproteobacteria bacterium]